MDQCFPSAFVRINWNRLGLSVVVTTLTILRANRSSSASRRGHRPPRRHRPRHPELYRMLSGMNNRMDDLCDRDSEAELDLVAVFLRRTAAAGHEATAELTDD
ncbi:hypothetical protein ACQP1G_30960 [Nocardia sp. CA-107356]|uniref:hypothetical protein n=1 Tax=Nocardia sp. CA-107356 TaxID=3239972 RepID=UPI003D94A4A4